VKTARIAKNLGLFFMVRLTKIGKNLRPSRRFRYFHSGESGENSENGETSEQSPPFSPFSPLPTRNFS
jgi:hypothetical protein